MSDFIVPDMTEPIVAARTWEWTKSTTIPGLPQRKELRSGSWGVGLGIGPPPTTWHQTEPLEAICSLPGFLYGRTSPADIDAKMAEFKDAHSEGAPAEACSCGIYALADPYGLEAYSYADRVFGVVHLWGRVVPASRGWRAQFGRVAAIVGWTEPIPNPEPPAKTRRQRRRSRGKSYHRYIETPTKTDNRVLAHIAECYGVPLLFEWPALTQPQEVTT